MKKNWKLLLSGLLLVTILAFAACGGNGNGNNENGVGGGEASGNEGGGAVTGNGGGQQDLAPPRNLGGINIVIGNWWSDYDTDTFEPTTRGETERLDYRRYLENKHNFRIREERMGGWGDVRDMSALSLFAGDRDVHIWVQEPSWFGASHAHGFFAPIPVRFFEEDTGIQWSWDVLESSMRGGDPHAWAHGVSMAGGIYFNMRLFEEAGLEPDLPFTLQREGNWNWTTFTDIARATTRDPENIGVPSTWGLTTFHQDFLERAIASNNAAYVGVDPITGHFVNTTQTIEFLEALSWVVQLRDEMLTLHEDDIGGEWNAFVSMFNNGHGAMRSAGSYVAGAEINPNLADPWGFVAFPMGPRASGHYSFVGQNFMGIPASFSADEVEAIIYAYRMWIRPMEDDDPDDWIFANYANHYDSRSVDETMVYFTRNRDLQRVPLHVLVPGGMPHGAQFAFRVWVGNDPAAIVEEAQQVWNDELARANALISR
jgi:hypothetical protein